MRRALEIALFISLVNRSAPVTTSENDTHLPTKRWRLLTETIEHARVCSIRSRNFSFFSGIRWNTSREESDRKPKYGTILRGIRMDLGKPRKYPGLISQKYSRPSLNGHLYKTDTSVKRTPRVGPCLSQLAIFDFL